MMKKEELITMRAITLCFKKYLKPEEALILTNLGRTQFAKRCDEFNVYKTDTGYYKREDIDRIMEGVIGHHAAPDGARGAGSGFLIKLKAPGKKSA